MTPSELSALPFAVRFGMRLCFLNSQRGHIAVLAGCLVTAAIAALCSMALIVMGPRYSIEIGSPQERALVAYLTLHDGEAANDYMEQRQATRESGKDQTLIPVSKVDQWLAKPSPMILSTLSKGPLSPEMEPFRLAGLKLAQLKTGIVASFGPSVACSFTQAFQIGFASSETRSACWEPDLHPIFWLICGCLFLIFCLFFLLFGSIAEVAALSEPIRVFQRNSWEWLQFRADEDFRRVEKALLSWSSKRGQPAGDLGKKTPRL